MIQRWKDRHQLLYDLALVWAVGMAVLIFYLVFKNRIAP